MVIPAHLEFRQGVERSVRHRERGGTLALHHRGKVALTQLPEHALRPGNRVMCECSECCMGVELDI